MIATTLKDERKTMKKEKKNMKAIQKYNYQFFCCLIYWFFKYLEMSEKGRYHIL